MADHARGLASIVTIFVLLPVLALAQAAPDKKSAQSKPAGKGKAKAEEQTHPLALQRRTIAIALLTSLANEARSYQNQTLRARVQG